MPRKNRTYNDIDLIRIYEKHLSLEEKKRVKIYFVEELKAEGVSTIKEVIELIETFLEPVEEKLKNKKLKMILTAVLKLFKIIKPFF